MALTYYMIFFINHKILVKIFVRKGLTSFSHKAKRMQLIIFTNTKFSMTVKSTVTNHKAHASCITNIINRKSLVKVHLQMQHVSIKLETSAI